MSALPPKADMCGALAHVCFGPIADMFAMRGFSFAHRFSKLDLALALVDFAPLRW